MVRSMLPWWRVPPDLNRQLRMAAFAAGPQPPPPDGSVPRRTSTASSGWQLPPDLNRKLRRAVFPTGPQPPNRKLRLKHACQKTCQIEMSWWGSLKVKQFSGCIVIYGCCKAPGRRARRLSSHEMKASGCVVITNSGAPGPARVES